MHEILIEEKLRETLSKLYKKDRKRYDICMKKIEDIANNQGHADILEHQNSAELAKVATKG